MNTLTPRIHQEVRTKVLVAPPSVDQPSRFFAAVAVFASIVLLAGLFPLSRLLLFPYEFLVVNDGAQHWHPLLASATAVRLGFLQWGVVALAFGAFARKERPILLIPLTIATLTVLTIAMHAIVRWSGIGFEWNFWR